MADNVDIKDAHGDVKTMITTDTTGTEIHVPHHRVAAGLTVTGPSAQSANNMDLISGVSNGWYDASLWMSGAVQIIGGAGISAGAVTFEQTNDNSSTTGIPLEVTELGVVNTNSTVAAITIAASTRRVFGFGISCKYVRARISTAFTGGTVQAITQFSQASFADISLNVQQATAGNLLATVTPTSSSNTVAAQAAASTNSTLVKNGAGNLLTVALTNMTAAAKYFKLYNKASAPTVGTDTPVQTIPIPANSIVVFEYGPVGMRFGTGIGFGITGAMADADTTALAANDVKVHLTYS